MSLNKKAHFRQIALFLVAVILPSLVLVGFTLRMISQEEELLEKRAAEQRTLRVSTIATQLLAHLERVKLEEVAANNASLNLRDYRNSEVVLVARAHGTELQLPWKTAAGAPESALLEATFEKRILRGEFEEFTTGNLRSAQRVYRNLATESRDLVQSAYSRLLLARVLVKLARKEEAVQEYSRVASVPPTVVDEYGMPLASYACEQLLDMGKGIQETLELLRQVVETDRWLSPEVAYQMRGLSARISGLTTDGDVLESARNLSEEIASEVSGIEQVLALQIAFPASPELRSNLLEDTNPVWILFGEPPWLVSVASKPEDNLKCLVAVDFDLVRRDLVDELASEDTQPHTFALVPNQGQEGEALGASLPGLRIIFDAEQSAFASGSGRQFIYLMILFLAIGATSFGAYLLWRDVRRDIRLSEMRTQFVSGVSHELKTPLTAIRIFAETLRMGRSRHPEKQDEYLDIIVAESERLTRLINNVLDFSKMEKGNRSYRFASTLPSDIIETCARSFRYPLSQQGFNLEVEILEDLPEVKVDRDAIEQAVLNLLNNAIKYSGDSRDIALRLLRKGEHAVIQVQDRGIGIEPSEHKRIFERFYRVDSAVESGTVGTGIGLALASHIVEGHGGRIEVESTPGQGSTFSIFLKLESEP